MENPFDFQPQARISSTSKWPNLIVLIWEFESMNLSTDPSR